MLTSVNCIFRDFQLYTSYISSNFQSINSLYQLSDSILVDPLFQGQMILISIIKEQICSCHIQLLDGRDLMITNAAIQTRLQGLVLDYSSYGFFSFLVYCTICEVNILKNFLPSPTWFKVIVLVIDSKGINLANSDRYWMMHKIC